MAFISYDRAMELGQQQGSAMAFQLGQRPFSGADTSITDSPQGIGTTPEEQQGSAAGSLGGSTPGEEQHVGAAGPQQEVHNEGAVPVGAKKPGAERDVQ